MIKVGMLLLCMLDIGSLDGSGNKLFIKDVPMEILHITKDNNALVEYDLRAVSGIRFIGNEKSKAIFPVVDMTSPSYMNCKQKK